MILKIKHIIVTSLVFLVIIFAGLLWYVNFYEPAVVQAAAAQAMSSDEPVVSVVKAKTVIPEGATVREDQLVIDTIPEKDIVKGCATSVSQVAGKVALTGFEANEQIILGRLADGMEYELSDRYIAVDIPVENFVNDNVAAGSLVDILVDYGDGRYDVVLAKVRIFERKRDGIPQPAGSPGQAGAGQGNGTGAVGSYETGTPAEGGASGTGMHEGRVYAGSGQKDRVTIMVNEKEQKRLWQAMLMGRLDTRLYVDKDQPPGVVTFTSEEEGKAQQPQ